jgi:hypothetical protein
LPELTQDAHTIIVPVLPGLVGQFTSSPSEQTTWYGFIAFVYALASFVAAPFLGSLSDRYGRRPILLLGFCGVALNFFTTALATSLWMLVASRQGNAGVTLLANHLERTIKPNASAELTMTFGIYNELRDKPAIIEALEPLAEQAKADVSDVTDLAGDDDSAKAALQKTVDESNEFDSPSLYAARILAGTLLIPYPKKVMSADGEL